MRWEPKEFVDGGGSVITVMANAQHRPRPAPRAPRPLQGGFHANADWAQEHFSTKSRHTSDTL